jgi:hypothetical protein
MARRVSFPATTCSSYETTMRGDEEGDSSHASTTITTQQGTRRSFAAKPPDQQMDLAPSLLLDLSKSIYYRPVSSHSEWQTRQGFVRVYSLPSAFFFHIPIPFSLPLHFWDTALFRRGCFAVGLNRRSVQKYGGCLSRRSLVAGVGPFEADTIEYTDEVETTASSEQVTLTNVW